jgi:hypothetical protein
MVCMVLVTIAVLILASLATTLRAWLLRRASRRNARRLHRVASTRAQNYETLVGTLRGGTATTVKQTIGTHGRQDENLWLEQSGKRIDIVGPIEIEIGAVEHASWWKYRGTPIEHVQRHACSTLERTVADGDEISIAAVVEQGNGDGISRLVAPPGGSIYIAATKPQVAAFPLGAIRGAILSVAIALGVLGALHLVGTSELKDAKAHSDRLARWMTRLDEWSPVAIAAAMPGTRGEALDELESEIHNNFERSDAALALRVAYDDFVGGCPAAAYEEAGDVEAAITAAKRCAGAEYTAGLLAFVGRYDEAAGYLSEKNFDYLATTIAIARGDWQRAALGAEHVAVFEDGNGNVAAAAENRCLATLFRSYASEHVAFDRIPHRSESAGCELIDALRLPADKQAAALAAIKLPEDFIQHRDVKHGLEMLANPGRDDITRDDFLYDLQPVDWLARFTTGSAFSERRAAIDVVRGDFAKARQELAGAGAEIDSIARRIALHDGSPIAAAEYEPPWAELRRGEALDFGHLNVFPTGCATPVAFLSAEAGDGRLLAAALRRCDFWGSKDNVLGVLPRVQVHRDELASALRMSVDPASQASYKNIPFKIAEDASEQRDLARLAGDAERANVWQRIVARHDAVLADQRKVIAFLFWMI